MKKIEMEFIIDGKPVKAVTTYALVNEFGLKLTNPDFPTVMESLHIPVFALNHSRFLDRSLNMTEKGLDHAQTMTESLFRAYQRVSKFEEEIKSAVVKAIELNLPKRVKYYHSITKLQEEKTLIKQQLHEYSKNKDNQNRNEMTKKIVQNKKMKIKLKEDIIDAEINTLIELAKKIKGLFVDENSSVYSSNEVINKHILSFYNATMQRLNYEPLTTSLPMNIEDLIKNCKIAQRSEG